MKYIVYITTNKKNNKIYIGVHQTENPDVFDGYIGCGAFVNKPSSYNKGKCHLHNAILKYGVSLFYRQTIAVFDSLEEAKDLESWIVNDEFVKRTDTYNMVLGGGIPPTHNRKVFEFDQSGNLIKEWDSVKEILNLYGVNVARIRMAINDKRSFNDSYWSYENHININEYRISYRGYVYQYDSNGNFIRKFKNATEASLKLDIQREAIVNSVYDRTKCCGYYFLRADEDITLLLNLKSSKLIASVTPVYRYLNTGEFDKSYDSIALAVKDTPKTSHGNIIRAIKNGKTSGGYKWSYYKDTILPQNKLNPKAVKIAQYDKNHNLIKIWDSVAECKKIFPSCQKVCRKERKMTKGYIFEYTS